MQQNITSRTIFYVYLITNRFNCLYSHDVYSLSYVLKMSLRAT